MADSPLELSKLWKKQFNEATDLLDAEKYELAIEKLIETLATIEKLDREGSTAKGGDHDLRVPETMERLAYAYHKRGLLSNAEPIFRRAMSMLEGRMVGYSTSHRCANSLADLLSESGRGAEAEELRNQYPSFELDEPADYFTFDDTIENALMITLSNLAHNGKETKKLLAIMEDLVAHMENVLGPDSNVTVNGLIKVGSIALRYTEDKEKAIAFMSSALKVSLDKEDCDVEALATSMRMLALCDPHLPLSKALARKASNLEELSGTTTLAGSIAALLASMSNTPSIEMSVEDADRIILDWRASLIEESIPFVSMTLTEKQRYQQLLSFTTRALEIADECQRDCPPPLSTINLLSDASKCYLELGDPVNARLFKQKELDVIAEHWGEGHQMMLEAVEEMEELQKL